MDPDDPVENPPCARPPADCCRNKCLATFDDDFRSRLEAELSTLKRTEKQLYLFALLSINEEELTRRGKGGVRSSKYYQYTVKEYGHPRSVCKSAFIAMHDTTPGMVRSLCKKLSAGHLIPTDERGRHDKQPTISARMKQLIESHFYDTLRSPDISKCVKKRFGVPNIQQLWLDFKKKHGHLSCSTYNKYIRKVITPEVLKEFMSTNEAKKVLMCIKEYEETM